MTTSTHRGSAKIYEFPTRGRFAMAVQRQQTVATENHLALQAAPMAFSDAWYHEAAIQEAERTSKN
jgi:hypothetical protein